MSQNYKTDNSNVEQQLAYEIIATTDKCLFITGKAGTGKTTFIRRIQEEIDKTFLVLAPTGLAAIAAGGQTVHSFFGFPMEVIGPRTPLRVSNANMMLLRHVDTIIVDEASMLRSDMVDGMDRYLRLVFENNCPFGGKQVIFVGDLFQLPPVVRRGSPDEEMLKDLYGNGFPFFYKAKVLRSMDLSKIEFRKVYRQNDSEFLEILNKMRVGEIDDMGLSLLNSRVVTSDEIGDYTVTLTGCNKRAEIINEIRLAALDGEEVVYEGIKRGKIKAGDCVAPEFLKLKVGAQVIFCRNYYTAKCANGTIGKILGFDSDSIQVLLENGNTVTVERTTWESFERVYNRESKHIESKLVGSYTQFPLKLAWAITIHKSQGMTFDRMHFDLSWNTFASGQAYVAISRMRSLDGLTISRELTPFHIKANSEVKAFANSFNDFEMITDEIESGRMIRESVKRHDYDEAVVSLLKMAVSKMKRGDNRKAALLVKEMYDVMLDDEVLIGKTDGCNLIRGVGQTSSFLNSVICLYGHRYEEAIGYADLVLSRRNCPEAMFIKARAHFELGNFQEASNIVFELITRSNDENDKRAIDKKLLLFEAKINDRTGNPNIAICKKLIRICPSCYKAYQLIRREMIRNQKLLNLSAIECGGLIAGFEDTEKDDNAFMMLLAKYEVNSPEVKEFKRLILQMAA